VVDSLVIQAFREFQEMTVTAITAANRVTSTTSRNRAASRKSCRRKSEEEESFRLVSSMSRKKASPSKRFPAAAIPYLHALCF